MEWRNLESTAIAKESEPFKTKISFVKPEGTEYIKHMFECSFLLIPFVNFLQLFKWINPITCHRVGFFPHQHLGALIQQTVLPINLQLNLQHHYCQVPVSLLEKSLYKISIEFGGRDKDLVEKKGETSKQIVGLRNRLKVGREVFQGIVSTLKHKQQHHQSGSQKSWGL